MPRLTRDDMVAVLQAYQDELTVAAAHGAARYDAVFARPPAGVAVHEFDNAALLRRVNSEELKLLGYTAAQMLGKPVYEFVLMQDASRQSVQKKLAGEKDIKPFVRTFRKADGSGVVMLLVDRRLYDVAGEASGIRTAMMRIEEDEGS